MYFANKGAKYTSCAPKGRTSCHRSAVVQRNPHSQNMMYRLCRHYVLACGKHYVPPSGALLIYTHSRDIKDLFKGFKIGEKTLTTFRALWLHDFRSYEGQKLTSLFGSFRDGLKLPKTALLATFGYTWLHENRDDFSLRKPPRLKTKLLFFVFRFYSRRQGLALELILLFGEAFAFVNNLDHLKLSFQKVFVVKLLFVIYHLIVFL